MGWLASLVQCHICTNGWVGVYPEEADEQSLECEICGARDSKILERYGPNEKVEVVDQD